MRIVVGRYDTYEEPSLSQQRSDTSGAGVTSIIQGIIRKDSGQHHHQLSIAIMRSTNSIGMASCTVFALTVRTAQCFLPAYGHFSRRPPAPSNPMKSSKPNELFDSPGWEAIKRELDQVPVFSIANVEGQPIKYRLQKSEASFDVPLFYTHVSDALAELEKAKEITPLHGMDIIPYPLGGIFEMWARDTA